MIRSLPLAFIFSAFVFSPGSLFAGDAHPRHLPTVIVEPKIGDANPKRETYRGRYRGYYYDLSAITDPKGSSESADGLRHQIDIVERSGLSSRVLQFFQTMPIVIDDFACLGNMTAPTSGEPKPRRGRRSLTESRLGIFICRRINTVSGLSFVR